MLADMLQAIAHYIADELLVNLAYAVFVALVVYLIINFCK